MVDEAQAESFRVMAHAAMMTTLHEQLSHWPVFIKTPHVLGFCETLAVEYAQKQVEMLHESDRLISDCSLRLALEVAKREA